MKKLLSVILSLVLIMGTICAVPAFSASADAPGFNLNGWYVTQGAGGTVTSDTTAGTVAFTGTQYGAMYTKVSNLEVGKTYDFSFDTSPTSSFQLWVVPGTETLSFSNGLPNNSTRKHIISVSGTTFSAQITPEVTSYWFVFRNETGTAATSAFTFSNFKFEEASAEVLAGIAIADGNWKATNGTVTNNTNAHTVTATGLSYHSIYTTISGLAPNTVYELSFDMSAATGFKQLWMVPGSETLNLGGNTYPQNSSRFTAKLSTSGTKFVATFTANESSYHLVFRDHDATVTDITLSNFKLTAVKTFTEADFAGMAIADGTWKATNGSVTNDTNAHTVTANSLSYNSIYTTISGLTPNTVYELSFDMSAATGFKQLWMAPGSETLNLNGGTYPANAGTFTASISTNSGNKFVAQFTASETSYHLVFRDYDATVTNITLSNFVLTAVKTLTEADLAGNAIADGTWKATNGSVTNNTKAHTVTATGLSYHSIYTTISGLTPNTVYQLTFDMSANTGFKQLWMVPGSETLDLGGNTYPQNSSTFRATLGTEGTKFLAEFTANEASYHLVFRDYDATVTNITLSNFALTAVRTLSEAEIAGNDIANNGAWDVTKNASGTVTKSKGTVKFTGAQYQDVSLPLTDLEANTTYTLSFINSSSGIELFANTVYVIPGETTYAESLKSKEGTVVYSCEASNKVNDEGAIVTTVRFTTDDTNTNYLIVFHNDNVSEVTLSNFEFSYETAYEFAGTAIRTASEDATQAMRFKNTISKDLLANGYNGKEVVEYGTLAAFEANLVTDFTYENVDGLRIKKGVSYDKANSINVVFAEDDVDVTYTAALTNIKTRFYGLDMKVCSYMVLSDGSVIYGDLQTISVYGIMNAILNGDNDDDKAVVNAMLEDEAVLNGYNAWLAK